MPSVQCFKALLQSNFIEGNEAATEDVNLAEKVFSPNTRSFKEKSMPSKLAHIVDSLAKMLRKLIDASKELKLSTSRLSVSSLIFAVTAAHDLLFRLVVLAKSTN